jgi:hypothetical protein
VLADEIFHRRVEINHFGCRIGFDEAKLFLKGLEDGSVNFELPNRKVLRTLMDRVPKSRQCPPLRHPQPMLSVTLSDRRSARV